MKRILFFLCLLSASLTSAYANTDLSTSDLEANPENVYSADISGSTVTFNWWGACCGWYFSTDQDYCYLYDSVEITFTTEMTGLVGVILGVDYDYDDVDASSAGVWDESESTTTRTYTMTVDLDEKYCHKVKDIYLEANCDNCVITITSAKLISKTTGTMQPIVNVNNEAYIQTYWPDQENWEETETTGEGPSQQETTVSSGTITPTHNDNLIPGATLAFDVANGGLGWEYYTANTPLDLSGYSGVEVTYEVSDYNGGDAPSVMLYLVSGDGAGINSGNQPITSGTAFTFETNTDATDYVDTSDLRQFVIMASAPCTVTVSSIKLITKTISTSSADFITAYEGYHLLNLNVTKVGEWAGGVSDGSDTTNDKVTSSKIAFTKSEELVGYEYTSSDETPVHLNMTSYLPEGGSEGDEVDFAELEVRYTITSTAVRQSARLHVMLELQDGDGNYKNIEVYDHYGIGRLRVKFDDEEWSGKINFANIQKIMFSIENVTETTTLNIKSIQLLTAAQVAAEVGQDENLLMSQLYTWQDLDGTTITPVEDSDDLKATIKTKTNWTAAAWWVDNVSEDEYWGVELKVKANQHSVVRLSIENVTAGDGTFVQCISERGDTGNDTPSTEHTLILPFLKKDAGEYNKNISYTPANSTSSEGEDESIAQTAVTADDDSDDSSTHLDADINEIYLLWGLIGDSSDNADEAEATIEIVSAKLLKADTYDSDFLLIPINSDEGYGTYYNSSKNYRMPYGMKGTTITGAESIVYPESSGESDSGENQGEEDDESVDYITYSISAAWGYHPSSTEYNAGDIVPKGTPLLLQGSTDQDVTLLYTAFVASDALVEESDKEKSTGNMLHGTDDPISATQMADTTAFDNGDISSVDYYYYKLQYKEEEANGHGIGNIGFYWGEDDGATFAMNTYNHAWLALLQSTFSDSNGTANGIKISGFTGDDESENIDGDDSEDGDDTTTGISVVPATSVSNGAIYNLQGVRVNDMNGKGIYIVDGKKIVKQ